MSSQMQYVYLNGSLVLYISLANTYNLVSKCSLVKPGDEKIQEGSYFENLAHSRKEFCTVYENCNNVNNLILVLVYWQNAYFFFYNTLQMILYDSRQYQ